MASPEDGYTGRMNRFARVSLGLAILLSAPGLAPYQAFAQVVTGRVAASVPGSAAAGAIGAPGSAGLSLPAANLSVVPLSPSLTPASAPLLETAAAVRAAAAPVAAIDAARPLALVPAAITPAAVKAEPVASAPRAARVLAEGAARLEAASKPGSGSTPRAALGSIFEGETARRSALDEAPVAASAGDSNPNRLDPSSAREPAKGPRWVEKFSGDPSPSEPRRSLKRTLSVGFIAAVVPIAFTMAAVAIASAFGYDLHPNYQGPIGENVVPTLLQAVGVWIGAAIMAPVSEEAIFRGGFQGTLAKISAKLRLGDFVLPAIITSVVFAALHETADPLLFGTRLVHAFILSYVYKKEGILASMAAHGFFNGLLALSVVFAAAHAPLLSILAAPVSLYMALRARKFLKTQEDDKASGALAPYPMSGTLALIFAALLMAGYFFIMPNIFWPLGALALAYNGVKKLKAGK